jgi:hypothetical protein
MMLDSAGIVCALICTLAFKSENPVSCCCGINDSAKPRIWWPGSQAMAAWIQ